MQHINDLTHPPSVGETYLVDCVYYDDQWLPTLGPDHDDLEMKVKAWHFHLDQRFISFELNASLRASCKGQFVRDYGPLFCTPHYGVHRKTELKTLPMVCTRSDSEHPFLVNELESLYKDKILINGRCPHKGANLTNCTIRDGNVICPMHGLMFDAKTGRQVDRPALGVPLEKTYDVKLGGIC